MTPLRRISLVLLLLLVSSHIAFSSPVTFSLFVNYHSYISLPSFGVRVQTAEWNGFSVYAEIEELSLIGKATGPGDPLTILPVNSIYTVSISKRIGPLKLRYSHFSAHWHRLADYVMTGIENDIGWYGDTYFEIEYSF